MKNKINCKQCKRLADFLQEVKSDHPDYFCKPVPAFGDSGAKCLIVGLAPGKHGANASGRPFTGDHAGILLYQTLYDCGFSNKPVSSSVEDGLELINCKITNAVKCLPPQNKPTTSEINTCNQYLREEIQSLDKNSIVIALGTIAHNAVLKAQNLKLSQYKFGHCQTHSINNNLTLIDSYHCSRYNTQTKRLTAAMFQDVFNLARKRLDA